MIKIDCPDAKRMAAQLDAMGNNLLPAVVRRTVTNVGYIARRFAIQDIQRDMVTRNKFTTSRILVNAERARTSDIRAMKVSVGTPNDYMRTQEFGGTVKGKRKSKPIPTKIASNEGKGGGVRRKVPTRSMRMSTISFKSPKYRARSVKQAYFFAAVQTLEERNKFALLDANGNGQRGIYRIKGSLKRRMPKKRNSRGGRGRWEIKNLSIEMVWNLERTQVRLIPKPWLLPASLEAQELMPSIYRQELTKAINKLTARKTA